MKSIDKAKELVEKFKNVGCASFGAAEDNSAIQSALVAVEEILTMMELDDKENLDCHWINSGTYRYWENVKKEITQL